MLKDVIYFKTENGYVYANKAERFCGEIFRINANNHSKSFTEFKEFEVKMQLAMGYWTEIDESEYNLLK